MLELISCSFQNSDWEFFYSLDKPLTGQPLMTDDVMSLAIINAGLYQNIRNNVLKPRVIR